MFSSREKEAAVFLELKVHGVVVAERARKPRGPLTALSLGHLDNAKVCFVNHGYVVCSLFNANLFDACNSTESGQRWKS